MNRMLVLIPAPNFDRQSRRSAVSRCTVVPLLAATTL